MELPDPTPDTVAAIRPSLNPEVEVSNRWIHRQLELAVDPPGVSRRHARLRPAAGVDIIVSRYCGPRTGEIGVLRERLDELKAARAEHPHILHTTLSRTSDQFCEEWLDAVREYDVLFLQGYARGFRALGRLGTYSRYLQAQDATPEAPALPFR